MVDSAGRLSPVSLKSSLVVPELTHLLPVNALRAAGAGVMFPPYGGTTAGMAAPYLQLRSGGRVPLSSGFGTLTTCAQ